MSSLGEEILPVATTENNVQEIIKNQIDTNELLLYIKGTPDVPECGFSARVIQIMNLLGVKYKTVDVLKDQNIRQGVKLYSKWPTVPQVYFKKEFLGGCDVLIDMYQKGELQKKLKSGD